MAQQTTVILTDDIDGGKAVETVSFGLDGKQYEIDLGARNAKNLRKAIAAYVEAGRKVKATAGTGGAAKKTVGPSGGSDLSAIRAWANENGIPVASRGRISASIKEQYLAANAS
ncbi:MAG: Lsr2 family protein [Gemmatimonadales bacterium]